MRFSTKKTVILLLMVSVVFLGLAFSKKSIAYVQRWLNYSFCDEPVRYSIGVIDPRFNLTDQEVLENAHTAAETWNKIMGKMIFVYDPEAKLSINFIYDSRQKSINEINKSKKLVDAQKDELNNKTEDYNQQRLFLQNNSEQLNGEIEYWNNKGGAPKDIYKELTDRQKYLNSENERLNSLAETLNALSEKINQQVLEINNMVGKFNSLIKAKPEAGIYKGSSNTIEIYLFENNINLIHTLAHELGHALGLKHVEKEHALMYPVSSAESKITQEDIEEINDYCRERDTIELIKNDLNNFIYHLLAK